MTPHTHQGLDQSWGHFVKLARVIARKFMENLTAFTREVQEGAALVFLVRSSGYQLFTLRTIDQFNGAVVLEAEAACRIGDGDGCSVGSAGNLKQKLMLLRL